MPDALPTIDSTSDGRRGDAVSLHAPRQFTATPRLLCVRDAEPSWVHLAHSIQEAGVGAAPRSLGLDLP